MNQLICYRVRKGCSITISDFCWALHFTYLLIDLRGNIGFRYLVIITQLNGTDLLKFEWTSLAEMLII